MRAVVCLKRVPKTDTRIRIRSDGRGIDTEGVQYAIGPYDEIAIEEALRQKEKAGAGEVVVVCLGPGDARTQLRDALAMGADRAVLLVDESGDRDALSTGAALAEAVRALEPDLVLFGKQAVDDDGGLVPAAVCESLGIPCIGVVTKLELKDRQATAHRQIEGGHEVWQAPLPLGITCQKGLNEPRYASLPNIMKAKKKPLEEKPAPQAECRVETLSLSLPPPRPKGKIVGKGAAAASDLARLLHEEAKIL
ncbi:MAG: electron transfer flavoprotein subunit beta/FixA family protein [Planctomycetes bacterium]|nr:electron transfer flavoprotein subunit beta/FixA family protein [Planctomycetota bacterium]